MGMHGQPRFRDMAKNNGVATVAAVQQRSDFLKPSREGPPQSSLFTEAAAGSSNRTKSRRPFEAMRTIWHEARIGRFRRSGGQVVPLQASFRIPSSHTTIKGKPRDGGRSGVSVV